MNPLTDEFVNTAMRSDAEISKWIDDSANREEGLRGQVMARSSEVLAGVSTIQQVADRATAELQALEKRMDEVTVPPSTAQRITEWSLWGVTVVAALALVARFLAKWETAARLPLIAWLAQTSTWYFVGALVAMLIVVVKFREYAEKSAGARVQAARDDFGRREGMQAAKDAAEKQQNALEQALTEQIVRQARAAISVSERSYARIFPGSLTTTGLSDIITLEDTIPTTGRGQLENLIAQMRNAGTIGVAGPRGAGKTTLLKWFCRPDRAETPAPQRRIAVLVSAPVSYDARDFILHLFAEVCAEVLAFVGLPTDALAKSEETSRKEDNVSVDQREQQISVVARVIAALGAVLFVAGLLTLVVDIGARLPPAAPKQPPPAAASTSAATPAATSEPAKKADDTTFAGLHDTLLTFGTTLLFVGGMGWLFRRRLALGTVAPPAGPSLQRSLANLAAFERIHRYKNPPDPKLWKPIAERACRHLWEIQFQLSFSSGWEGSLEISGLGATYSETESIARNQRTLPEIVDEFQDFVRALPENTRLVVGIDEMDKMGDADKAQQFLNDIKGMFGLAPNCLFLISVSESAMSNFQRRGLAVRDAFDSSFHEVLNVAHLSLNESVQLLERRIIGLPMPFLALCHCLSGGLPRDLVRACRKVVHASGGLLGAVAPGGQDLNLVLTAALEGELTNRVNAVDALLDHFQVEPELSAFTTQLNALRKMNWAAPDLAGSAGILWRIVPAKTGAGSNDDGDRQRAELRAFSRETAAHVFYLAAIHRLFSSEAFGYALGGPQDVAFQGRLNRLAEAWQRGAGNPTLAVALVRQFWTAENWGDLSAAPGGPN